ncbi:hypothetical protein GCM10010249_59810 [Streptomyces roseolilacinus]|uniref:Uncharacterized protein n=1 Tax=Streptomyces roseolilacinus TaxID=66904 RepID=A0A918EPI3_9ACTN|nr:hypothetical protein GCM10010249_59810 [Streptomyces roseolilacinus]
MLDDAAALTRVYSGASIRHTTGKPLTLEKAHEEADGVVVVRMFLADRLGLFLQGEEAMDRIDDAVRKLNRGPRPGRGRPAWSRSSPAKPPRCRLRTPDPRAIQRPVRHDDPREGCAVSDAGRRRCGGRRPAR